MKVTSSAASPTVEDVSASSQFLVDHLGYHQDMAADGFAALSRHDAAMNIVFLRRGFEVMPLEFRDQHASGVIVALIVEDLDAELARLVDEGVEITMPLREEEWGERLFQITDPNGIVLQFVQWT
ncbi:MAG: VOC family protein [Nakamurella sp.]